MSSGIDKAVNNAISVDAYGTEFASSAPPSYDALLAKCAAALKAAKAAEAAYRQVAPTGKKVFTFFFFFSFRTHLMVLLYSSDSK